MAPTHSGATAPVRAQGPARYSVLEHGLAGVGGPQARPEVDAMSRSGSVGGLGSSCSPVDGTEWGGQAVSF